MPCRSRQGPYHTPRTHKASTQHSHKIHIYSETLPALPFYKLELVRMRRGSTSELNVNCVFTSLETSLWRVVVMSPTLFAMNVNISVNWGSHVATSLCPSDFDRPFDLRTHRNYLNIRWIIINTPVDWHRRQGDLSICYRNHLTKYYISASITIARWVVSLSRFSLTFRYSIVAIVWCRRQCCAKFQIVIQTSTCIHNREWYRLYASAYILWTRSLQRARCSIALTRYVSTI